MTDKLIFDMAGKVGKVLHEFKEGKLRSGKPGPGKGPMVKSRSQALAIALSEARKAGEKIPFPKKRKLSTDTGHMFA